MKHFSSMARAFSFRRPASSDTLVRADSSLARGGRVHLSLLAIGAPVLLGLVVANSVGATPQDFSQRRTALSSLRPFTVVDTDGDGLDDALESGQQSAAAFVDTDTDGWNDAEELARGSLSNVHCSQPGEAPNSLGARAYMRNGYLHVSFAAYSRNGSFSSMKLSLGVYAFETMIPLAPASYVQNMTITTVPTLGSDELLVVSDVVLPMWPLTSSGSMSIYGTLSMGEELTSAAAVNLVMRGSTPTEVITPSQLSPLASEVLGEGLLYRPLGGTTTPAQWSAGEICFQRLESVGTHGAVVTQEVTSATCIEGWDGSCDAGSCSTSVGTTVDLVDPGALVGG